ncbi:hypothetical protein DNU06_15815 [Putridiphycobacter roseus]|uniref:Glycosyltransferase RgtA/B/C/D-like domain-containing protein n=1 Tax=Putridiphycobacter roseus TaxID=2219161 RepID=A0A2W1NCJ9_9FLAO|nr:hypothetical protein [Putridiphycobacter roseus]PZE15846.1 hypothetical protein DNU06_15815 [Putridiphycobacter roseus]
MIKKVLALLLITLLLADIGYTFLQNYHTPFDGDMAGGIVPADDVKPILASPLGLKIFKEHNTYPNPNRFFCHWSFYEYFNNVPLFIQNFTSPINSAYLSCALAKTMIQVIIIFLLSLLIAGGILKFDFLVAAILITPLFQTNGYRSYMGIIDPSTTYTFFYALPTIFVLIYFIPLFLKHFYGLELKRMKYLKYLWIPLALISSLSGPLNPGISLVVSLLIFTYYFTKNLNNSAIKNRFTKIKLAIQNIPNENYFYLIPICIFSLYSLFLGSYNSIDLSNKIPLSVLYSRLPEGIYYSFTQKLGFPILFLTLTINTLIIRYKIRTPEGKKLLNIFKWIGFFALIYIILLPLGGYRSYRPYVLRYDTIIPITLSLMFIFAKTTIFILSSFSSRQKYWYIPLVVLVIFVFTNSDKPKFDKNICERNAILQIARSKEPIVKIDDNCTVLSWTIIENPQESVLKTKLLKIWRIIDDDKLYYQKSPVANTL